MHFTWGLSPSENAVLVTIVGNDSEPVEATKLVQVQCIRGCWVLRPAPGDRMKVIHEIISDPKAPALFVNQATVENVYETLRQMPLVLQEPRYAEGLSLPGDVPSIQSFTAVGNSFVQCIQGGK